MTIAHSGQALAPHDAYTAWNVDPLLITALLLTVCVYERGRARAGPRSSHPRRDQYFYAALIALAIALLTPLDAISHVLASAHMIQHILFVLVAAPLIALSSPSAMLWRGTPPVVRRRLQTWRQRLRLTTSNTQLLREPATVWLLHAATLWFWHAATPYDAALEHPGLHAVEHGMFLVTGIMFWRVVIRSRYGREMSSGLGLLLVFSMAIQSGFLSALLTFARSPWYTSYASTTASWNLDPLGDQQLAGVIMWIPAGVVYLAAGLALLSAWIGDAETVDGEIVP